MGNIVNSLQNRVVTMENVPTPTMKSLTENQIKIIKSTWDIPAAKVTSQSNGVNGRSLD